MPNVTSCKIKCNQGFFEQIYSTVKAKLKLDGKQEISKILLSNNFIHGRI